MALLALQSEALKLVRANGHLSELWHVELVQTIAALIEQQGKCERIKTPGEGSGAEHRCQRRSAPPVVA